MCFNLSAVSLADKGSTLSSEAVTDSLASVDGHYGYMGTHTHTHTHTHRIHSCSLPSHWLSDVLCFLIGVFLPLRIGDF